MDKGASTRNLIEKIEQLPIMVQAGVIKQVSLV